ncbi:PilX N-terminal domain-containing pilus assembly protein, partial [Acinetobacter nosocomialis]|uniref:PilX N-terminal domain-containing pilus assembly protein n=1 Tax=Acinetobacter nosocomialis TaxID=106654 RepID=UPI0024556F4D
MTHLRSKYIVQHHQKGATLIVVLIILLIVIAVGVLAIRVAIVSLKVATNSQIGQLNFQSSDTPIPVSYTHLRAHETNRHRGWRD